MVAALSLPIRAALDKSLIIREVVGAWTTCDVVTYVYITCRYAIERTSDFIKVWFWPRSGAPSDVQNGESSVNTDGWVRYTHRVRTLP